MRRIYRWLAATGFFGEKLHCKYRHNGQPCPGQFVDDDHGCMP